MSVPHSYSPDCEECEGYCLRLAEVDQLRTDAMTLAMRLYCEPMDSHAPETREVMARWRPLVEAEIERRVESAS